MSSWVVPGFAEERGLGVGGSGRVVAAVHVASGTRVAIKYLSPRLLAAPGFLEAFRSEAALLRTLDVPQVVRLFDYAEAPGQGAAIIMELVNGVSLHQMITRQGPTGPESALLVLKGSLLGLAAAHSLGIVHRDYKPENVLVDGQGTSKLTDFGVAARTGQAASGGTPLYMAPEQWAGAPASPATDIYAATAVFFECLTGMTPFSGPPAQLAAQHEHAAVPAGLVDEPLRPLIMRGMAKDLAARPASATGFVAELEATAVVACGAGWEAAGRGQLAARAAALLALLYGTAGAATATTGAGSGTATTTTWLSAAKSAIATHAILYTGIAAATAGIAAGTLAGISRTTGPGRTASLTPAASPSVPGSTAQDILTCTADQLQVRADSYFVGTGHVDDIVGLWNTGPTCKLTGWASVGAVKASGARSFPAQELNGWGWGGNPTLTAPPTVVIAHGREGNVVIHGLNFRANGSPCAAPFKTLQVTPPGARLVTIALPYLPDCGPLSVSPVVPPTEVP
jgi:eukaryotic-like serine/threonine-protein kinase